MPIFPSPRAIPIPSHPIRTVTATKSRLTNIILFQPGQSVDTLARKRLARHIQLTIPIHAARRPEKLDARFDQPRQPEHEQDEGAEDDDAGEEHALRDEDEDDDEEEDGEGGGGHLVREQPDR